MSVSLHATAVALGEVGVLIQGPSGAGKSTLALALIDEARAQGRYGALVGDDRVIVEAAHGRLILAGAPGFEGLIESRGEGIVRRPHEPAAVAALVVDLCPKGSAPPRFPDPTAEHIDILGVTLPRLLLDLAPGVVFGARMTLRRLMITPTECPAIGNFA